MSNSNVNMAIVEKSLMTEAITVNMSKKYICHQDLKCIECDYLTNCKKMLCQHEICHHNINCFNMKVYKCGYCDNEKMFESKGSFSFHLLSVHNIVTHSIRKS